MIDIHSHILPGIDDGATTWEDSLEMARSAVDDGIHTIIASPHHQNGRYINKKADILPLVEQFNRQLESQGIPLGVVPGQEVRMHGEILEHYQEGELLPINGIGNPYMLVEFPSNHVPRYAKQLLFDIQVAGLQPIIVHPERNSQIIQNPELLYEMVDKGAFTQVTAASLIGGFGKKIKKFSEQLLEANLTHLIASDAHNTTTRGFCMAEAYDQIEETFGPDLVDLLLENSESVVAGKPVISEPPQSIKKRKLLGLFG